MRRRILILGTVAAQGSLATHMVVPVLPSIAQDFATSGRVAQFALTVYLTGLAIGQFASGPIGDHYGRQRLLVIGGALFVAGTAICWSAPGVALLLAGRLVQALGAAAGLVAARAMVGAARESGARDMALLSAIVMLSPVFAPVIGSAVALALGWRAIFAVLLAVGLVALATASCWIVEVPRARPARIEAITGWRAVLAASGFRRHLAIGTAMSAGLYAFLASAPFFLTHRFGVPEARLGPIFGVVASGAGVGALVSSRLARRIAPPEIVRAGVVLAFLAASLLLAAALLGGTITAIVAPMALYALAGGLILPNAIMISIGEAGDRVATAVSLYGALQMAGSGMATMIVGGLAGGDLVATAAVIFAAAAFAAILRLVLADNAASYNKIPGRE